MIGFKRYLLWKTSLPVFLFVFIVVVLSSLSFYIGSKGPLSKIDNGNNIADKDAEITQLKNQLDSKNEEINLALQGRGKILNTSESSYDYSDFGVYSPLFESKDVQITVYWYNAQTITERDLGIDDNTSVTSWELTSLKDISLGTNVDYSLATFGGYENYALHAKTLADIRKEWKENYSSKENIIWNFRLRSYS